MQRLKKRADFQRISKQGLVVKTPAFVLLYMPGQTETSRIGFTATKRTIGAAVQRNRAKRRLRALVAQEISQNPFFALPTHLPVVDCVLIARPVVLQRPFAKMVQDIRCFLQKEGFSFVQDASNNTGNPAKKVNKERPYA